MDDNKVLIKHKWKPFFKVYSKIKVPWLLFVIGWISKFGMTTIYMKIPQYTMKLMEGEIFNSNLVKKYIIISAMSAALTICFLITNGIAGLKTIRNMRNLIWSKLIRIPMPYFNKEEPSGLISRVTNDSENILTPLSGLGQFIGGVYGTVGVVIIMYKMNKTLTLLLLLMIPWGIFTNWFMGKFFYKIGALVQNTYAAMTGFFSERLSNVHMIKIFGAEEKEIKEGFEAINNRYDASVYSAKINLYFDPIYGSIEVIMTLIIFVIGGVYVSKGKLTVASLIAFYMYIEQLSTQLSSIFGYYAMVKDAHGSMSKVLEILEENSEKIERKKSFDIPNSDIKLENIKFGYTDKEILSDLSFIIPKGKVTAIVGLSGAGKTTILNLLERFYESVSGRIMFGDTPVEDIHLNEWRQAFGYVSQNSPLLFGTIRENICYGIDRDISEEEIIRATKLANAYEIIQRFPEGFETDVGDVGGKLSGGERQRIAIARAIITDPDYLLLDEATCSLDARAVKVVQEALKNLMKDRTTVVIAHSMDTIIDADQIVVVDEGKVKGIGKHEQLYKDCDLYREFIDLQDLCGECA